MTAPLVDVPDDALRFLRAYDSYVVVGHIDPDADCAGSQLALTFGLRSLGKHVVAANAGPFDRIEIAPLAEHFSTALDAATLPDTTAAIVVDCSTLDRLGDLQNAVSRLPVMVIDHHRQGETFGDVRFVRPDVPAATILVTALLQALDMTWSSEIAELLFLGLATDSGFFRFLDADQVVAFDAAGFLARQGVSPRAIARRIESGRPFESRLLLARMLERVETLGGGQILLTYQTAADEREFGKRRDSDALYRLLTAVEGVRVVIVAKEKPEGWAVSFRSTDETDVAGIAATLGGGGHHNASGALIRDGKDATLVRLREIARSISVG